MKRNEVPEKLYLIQHNGLICYCRNNNDDIEYTRTDAFIEKVTQFLYDYNQKQVLKHGAKATLGCGEYTINVDEFRKYMKGE
jgi:hypothetical protein